MDKRNKKKKERRKKEEEEDKKGEREEEGGRGGGETKFVDYICNPNIKESSSRIGSSRLSLAT